MAKHALATMLLGLCGQWPVAGMAAAPVTSEAVAAVNAVADDLLSHWQRTSTDVRFQNGLTIEAFDPVTLENAQQDAQFARDMLARLDTIALDGLPRAQWLLARTIRHELQGAARAAENYWYDFGVTPYAGGGEFNYAQTILAAQPLKTPADLDRYLRLLDSYAVMCDQVAAKTRAQAERNIRVSIPAIPGVMQLFAKLRASAAETLIPAPARLVGLPATRLQAFDAAVRKRIDTRIIPAYDAIVAIFDAEYSRQAPAEVGVGRLPGGKEHYLRVIDEVGVTLTPAQIHELGQRRVAELDAQMRTLREQIGFKGSREAFHEQLLKDPRFLARTSQEMGERLMAHVKRMEPHIPAYFSKIPQARYGVKPLDAALASGQTFGFYLSPKPADPVGYYYYNGSDLQNRSLFAAAHLIFHELLPGHHLQIALQLENTETHPVRRLIGPDAFTEGWAEYAASLGKEMGLFADPYDLYGQLVMESFFAVRLVVDTGMNYFDWPLERARTYMKAHVLNSETEIASETLRYSTDLFGQALNYRLGYEKFWELRHRAEQALGRQFDIRAFHAVAINDGAMPLAVLDEQIDWFIAQQRSTARMAHELVAHSEVVIDQPAEKIWPHILDPNKWKQGVRLVHVSGEVGKTGEVFAAMPQTGGEGKPAFHVQNVEVVPQRRRTIKMYEADGGALTGYAAWELTEEAGGGTRVSYRVYSESLLSQDEIGKRNARELAQADARNLEENNARFGKELGNLKALVEGHARPARSRVLQLEDYLALEQLSQPQISSDGRTIIYSRSRIDSVADRRDSEWWVMDADGGHKRRLMSGGSNVRWSPDGSRIAYIDAADHGAAIFVRRMDAQGSPTQITHGGPNPQRVFWSPDGRWIAFKAMVPAAPQWSITLPRRPAGAKWTDDATVVDRLHYRADKIGHIPGYVHIFVVPAEGGAARQVTRGEWHAEPRKVGLHSWPGGDLEWTRDSRSIVFGADLRGEDVFARASVNIVDIADGRIRTIAGTEGLWGEAASPRVSPDGKRVAYVGEQAPGSSNFSPFEIRVADLDGGNEIVVLQGLSSSVDYLQWTPDSRALYYVIAKEGSRSLYCVSLSGKVEPVSIAAGTQSLSLSSFDGNGIAVGALTSAYKTADIVSIDLRNGRRRPLASVNAELFAGIELGRVEEIWYDATDRTRVQGWIVYPPGFDARKKYPLILKIHGGPAIMLDGSFAFDVQAFAAQGYVVLLPNYRGSPGYSLDFAQRIYKSFPGGPAYTDLISGVDAVVARGFVDESRMYVMGHSAGGALTSWIITQTQRFAAAAALSPYVNLISMTGTADIPTWAFSVFERPFWEAPDAWLSNSAIMHIGKVSTPTLVMVGENDLRTPVGQSEELFTGLKQVGVPAKLVLIKDEAHGLASRPSNMLRTHLYVLKWFGEWPRRDRS